MIVSPMSQSKITNQETDYPPAQESKIEPNRVCRCSRKKPTKTFLFDSKNLFYRDYESMYTFDSNICSKCGKKFCKKSSLNGSNGSWTNTDDVKKLDKNELEAKLRVTREARNRMVHSKTDTGKTKVQHGPIVKPVEDVLEDFHAPDIWYIYSNLHPYVLDENNVVYKKCGVLLYRSLCGKVIDKKLIQDGTYSLGVHMNNCFYKNDFDKAVVTHFLMRSSWPSSCVNGDFREGYNGLAYRPFVDFASVQLPANGAPTIQRKKILLGLCQKNYGWLHSDLIYGSVEHVDRKQRLLAERVILNTSTQKYYNNNGVPNLYDQTTLEQARGLGFSSSFDTFYKLPAVDTPGEIDWFAKNTYSVKIKGGYASVKSGEVPVLLFDTKRQNNDSSKYNKTVMLSFSGLDKQFLHYEMSGDNILLATKRLLAARKNEDYLYHNQIQSLQSLDAYGLIDHKILKDLKVQIYEDGVVIGDKRNSHFVPSVCVHDPVVLKGVKRMLGRVDRNGVDSYLDNIKDSAHWAYYSGYIKCLELNDMLLGRDHCAEIKHTKRKLRQQYVNGVQLHEETDLMVTRLTGYLKKEWAKPGKVGRIFVDYGAGCMYANEIPEYVKTCLARSFYFKTGDLWDKGCVTINIMAKPKSDSMCVAFNDMIRATNSLNEIYITIYSDDSVYCGNIDGAPFGYNVDISSCDSSNNSLVFSLVGTMMARFNRERASGLIKQCMLPIRIPNPDNPAEALTVQFHSAYEGSGTVLTTVLNHTASYLIALNFISVLNQNNLVSDSIVTGAEYAGHLVTLESWVLDDVPIYEKMQFLKHSPILSTCGKWIPTLNYGCIFRSLGSLDDDMEAKQLGISDAEFSVMSFAEKMERFISGVVRGLVHEPSSSILTSLRSRFQSDSIDIVLDNAVRAIMPEINIESDLIYGEKRASFELDMNSVNRRYDTQIQDLEVLISHIRFSQLGMDSVTCAVSQFYKIDYGM